MADEKITFMTQEGYDEKLKELQYRENELRNSISDQIKYAKSLGDFSENAELDAAKKDENDNEAKIAQLRHELATAKIIVANNYTVYDYEDETEYKYKLVGASEASLLEGKISLESPMGIALKGKKPGDEVFVKTSANDGYKIKVLKVE